METASGFQSLKSPTTETRVGATDVAGDW